jgi:alanyl-tRNA synthetase
LHECLYLQVVPGATAFLLFSAMGFPVDLTQLMAEEAGLTVDMAEYHEKMEEDKARSAAAEVGICVRFGTAKCQLSINQSSEKCTKL